MSLVPYLLNEMLEPFNVPILYDQNFGLGISPSDFINTPQLLTVPFRSGYVRPWRHINTSNSGISNITNDKDGLKINLDVQQFKPEELSVKVVDDYVIIEGKHEERSDEHGFVSRQFTRRYKLPSDVDAKALASNLSSDGVLQLCAPKKAVQPGGERAIPITQTNKPALKHDEKKK